jgi:hypothetical protein
MKKRPFPHLGETAGQCSAARLVHGSHKETLVQADGAPSPLRFEPRQWVLNHPARGIGDPRLVKRTFCDAVIGAATGKVTGG